MPTPVQARFDSREKHADLTNSPCNILADFQDLAARLAAVEMNYGDLHQAQVNLLAEVADLKNQVMNLSEGLLELTQKLVDGGYLH